VIEMTREGVLILSILGIAYLAIAVTVLLS